MFTAGELAKKLGIQSVIMTKKESYVLWHIQRPAIVSMTRPAWNNYRKLSCCVSWISSQLNGANLSPFLSLLFCECVRQFQLPQPPLRLIQLPSHSQNNSLEISDRGWWILAKYKAGGRSLADARQGRKTQQFAKIRRPRRVQIGAVELTRSVKQ